MPAAKRSRLQSLTFGRPPTASKPTRVLAARHTRRIIRAHHNLNKQLAQAKAKGDDAQVKQIEKALAEQGGLAAYQEASIQGQARTRGGDSSIELLRWLTESEITSNTTTTHENADIINKDDEVNRGWSLLEVGALSTTNACSRATKIFHSVTRIDLNAQGPGILQQDFMQRPLPRSSSEQFDILSLSLVLNFVPDSAQRGEMLWRTTQFLKSPSSSPPSTPETKKITPSLFLVLPLPCITNSRYMNEAHLGEIMAYLGYELLQRKHTSKLYYSLWRLCRPAIPQSAQRKKEFRKTKLQDGSKMNNFCIELLHAGSCDEPTT